MGALLTGRRRPRHPRITRRPRSGPLKVRARLARIRGVRWPAREETIVRPPVIIRRRELALTLLPETRQKTAPSWVRDGVPHRLETRPHVRAALRAGRPRPDVTPETGEADLRLSVLPVPSADAETRVMNVRGERARVTRPRGYVMWHALADRRRFGDGRVGGPSHTVAPLLVHGTPRVRA